nr:unnamed protein product [Callosobruchus analis]
MYIITGIILPTPVYRLPVLVLLSHIPPPELRRKSSVLKEYDQILNNPHFRSTAICKDWKGTDYVRRTRALFKEFRKLQQNPNRPLHNDIPTLRRNRLRSRKSPLWKAEQLVNNNVETVDLWKQNCQLIEDLEVRELFEKYDCDTTGAHLHRALCVKLNRIRSGYGRCGDSLYKWGLTDSPGCKCGANY